MRASKSIGTFVALAAAAVVWGGAPSAQAGGAVIYHYGPDAFPVEDVTPEVLGTAADLLIQEIAKQEGLDLSQQDGAEVAGFKTALVADLTEQFAGMKLGYMCEVFGLFWAYFAWWDCKPVFFKQTSADEITYLPADEAQAKKEAEEEISDPEEREAAVQQVMAVVHAFEAKAGGKKLPEAYPLSAAKMGFWTKNGRWIFGAIILLVIAFFVWKAVSKKKDAAPAAPANYPPVPGGGYPPPGANYPPVPGAPPTNVPPQG
ncbi:MAG: hypothetical protein JXB32_26310 [Deltaproteobacteria bacterium]|nr:hypothetical protein [Deltaproteobacteria bacterium]